MNDHIVELVVLGIRGAVGLEPHDELGLRQWAGVDLQMRYFVKRKELRAASKALSFDARESPSGEGTNMK